MPSIFEMESMGKARDQLSYWLWRKQLLLAQFPFFLESTLHHPAAAIKNIKESLKQWESWCRDIKSKLTQENQASIPHPHNFKMTV